MRRISILPKSNILSVALIASFLVQDIFMFLLTALDVLPVKFAIFIIAALTIADICFIRLMNDRKKGGNRRLVGFIISVLMINILTMGSFYLYNTAEALIKISEEKANMEEFHVIVLADSRYEKPSQIKGQAVYTIDTESKMHKEAEEKLLTKVDVDYKYEADLEAVGNHIYDKSGNSHDEIIFLSNNNYDILCENDKEFKSSTRKLFSVEVAIKSDDFAKRIDVREDPFNIYISGIDVWGDIEKVSRSDVNMIVTVNPQTKELLLTSIPRDSYVKLHSFGEYDKLTHSGIYGIEETISTVEDWLDVDINYYVRANFSMVVDLVNAINGITVKSDFAFKSKVSDYTYEVGENKMDGKAALYFARERKAFEDEDEERIRNQQKVMSAIIKKATQSEVILVNYVDILDAVEGHMQTNLSNKEISALVKMQLNDMSGWKIKTISVDGDDAERGTLSMGMGRPLFVSIPIEESVEKVQKAIHETMYPVEL